MIVDVAGRPSVSAFRRVLAADGRLVLVGAGRGFSDTVGRLIGAQVRARLLKQPVINFIADVQLHHLDTLREMCEAGQIRPQIERSYPLSDAAAALARAETGQVGGKLVLRVRDEARGRSQPPGGR